MTNPRHAVKQAHERFQVGLLIAELNKRHGSRFVVISEPEPPEAIIQSNRTTRWVEVVTAYLNSDFARDLNSFATVGEVHRSSSGTLIVEPDRQSAQNFISVVKGKLEKSTYIPFRDRYGPGYLLVSIQNPLFDSDTLAAIDELWHAANIDDQDCFRSIYLTYRSECGYKIRRWSPRTKLENS
jgi:hypothetical protein